MRKLALLLFFVAGSAFAQVPAYPSRVNVFGPRQRFETPLDLRCVSMASQPLSAAGRASIGCDSSSGAIEVSINGGAFAAVGGGGSGTVTSVGNGTISALFTASWATATTTPALSLAFANQSGRKFFASPSDGSSGAITARAIVAADVPTLNQNTTGTAAALAANGTNCTGAQKASGVDASGAAEGCSAIAYSDVTGTPSLAAVATTGSASDLSSGTLPAGRLPALTGDITTSAGSASTTLATVTVPKGGTGLTTLTANNVILGNGTSTPQFVAPGSSGNVLTSNGTTWASVAAAGASPAGSGTEVQVRNGSSFAALTGSSTSGAQLTLGGELFLPTNLGATACALCFNGDAGEGLAYRSANVYSFMNGGGEAVRFNGDGSITWLVDFIKQYANGVTDQSSYANPAVTLSTSGTTTDTASVIPATTVVRYIGYRVTTAIAGSGVTGFTVQLGTAGSPWVTMGSSTTTQTGLTAGSSGILRPPTYDGGDNGGSANLLRVTAIGGTPSAGVVRLVPVYMRITAPSS